MHSIVVYWLYMKLIKLGRGDIKFSQVLLIATAFLNHINFTYFQVFPIDHLQIFTDEELERLLCGESETWNVSFSPLGQTKINICIC